VLRQAPRRRAFAGGTNPADRPALGSTKPDCNKTAGHRTARRPNYAMSTSMRFSRKDVKWGFLSTFLNISAGIILLPLMLHFLPPADVGLWIVFVTLANLARLIEPGLRQTLTRYTAYVFSGSDTLRQNGLDLVPDTAQMNVALLGDLLAAARYVYLWVGLAAAFALLVVGTAFIMFVASPDQPPRYVFTAWISFAGGYVITLYYSYYSALLQGRGDITDANRIIVISRTLFIVLGAALLLLGWGLVGVGLASLVAAVVDRLLTYRYFFADHRPETVHLRTRPGSHTEVLPKLWHNSLRLGLVHLAGFVTLNANILTASVLLGVEHVANYNLTIQLLTALLILSGFPFQIQVPHLNAYQIQGRKSDLRYAYGLAITAAVTLFCAGAALLFLTGETLLRLIGSETLLVPDAMLLALLIVMLLELNLLLSAAYLTTLNEIPFVRASIVSSVCVVGMGFVLARYTHLGLWSFVIAQAVVQGSYNYWKWPRQTLAHLDCTFLGQFRYGFTRMKRLMREETPGTT
jgi:O-antigen/teichoic acid export membrane protein